MDEPATPALGYKYILQTFGKAILFERQYSTNAQERENKANTFEVPPEDFYSVPSKKGASEGLTKTSKKVKLSDGSKSLEFLSGVFGKNIQEELRDGSDGEKDEKTKPEDSKAPLNPKGSFKIIEEAYVKSESGFKILPRQRETGHKRPDEYDEEYDRGKLPKKKDRFHAMLRFQNANMFQKEQDVRNRTKSHKKGNTNTK